MFAAPVPDLPGMSRRLFERRGDVVAFALLVGLAATFIHGYYFGRINQVCQLPQLFRELDSGYLANDFFVNDTAEHVGPRLFYVKALALAARLVPVPLLFFILTWLQNAALALVTLVVAREMFGGSELAAAVSTTLVMSVHGVGLGMMSFLVHPAVIPHSLSLAPALLALWQGIRGRPLACAAIAVPAVLIHPLVGILCGALGLATAALSSLLGIGAEGRARRLRTIGLALAGFGLLAAIAGVFWLVSRGERLMSDREYVELYGYFRNPHHVVPSRFPLKEWIALAAFVAAGVVSWKWWRGDASTDRPRALRFAVAFGLIVLLWLGGFLFVEVLPSRLWATLQTFRLVFAVKWMGLLLFGGTIARLATGPEPGQPAVAALAFFPAGFGQPHAVLWAHVAEFLRRRAGGAAPAARWLVTALSVLVGAGIVYLLGFSNTEFLALVVLGLVTLCWLAPARRARRYLVASLVVAVAVGLIVVNKYRPLTPVGRLLSGTEPTFTLAGDANNSQDIVAAFCRDHTPADAVFLVPPWHERFWLIARRAVVVKFKCTLVHDRGLLEWRQRLRDCYGEVSRSGFSAVGEMDSSFAYVTDDRILAVADKYGATHAVLRRGVQTGFPVLFEEELYKVVKIDPAELVPTIDLVVFRAAEGQVGYAGAYFSWLLEQRFPGAIPGQAFLVPVGEPADTARAVSTYESAVDEGRLADLGERYTVWRGAGPDGVPVTVMFFLPGHFRP